VTYDSFGAHHDWSSFFGSSVIGSLRFFRTSQGTRTDKDEGYLCRRSMIHTRSHPWPHIQQSKHHEYELLSVSANSDYHYLRRWLQNDTIVRTTAQLPSCLIAGFEF
jgi:hypothetical protein